MEYHDETPSSSSSSRDQGLRTVELPADGSDCPICWEGNGEKTEEWVETPSVSRVLDGGEISGDLPHMPAKLAGDGDEETEDRTVEAPDDGSGSPICLDGGDGIGGEGEKSHKTTTEEETWVETPCEH
uniref:Uncharacterized protein n=1 Tax=Leersia perrieri TaxID=77586 RepID=A0A0D9WLR1_9ORYZ